MEVAECGSGERFSKNVTYLLLGRNILNIYTTTLDELVEVVVLEADVFCPRKHSGGLSNRNCTLVILEDCIFNGRSLKRKIQNRGQFLD